MKKTNLFLIAVLFSANALASDVETEPNNKMNEANPITPGVMLEGQVSNTRPTEDWFVFETSQSDTLTFTILSSNNGYGNKISLYDADKNELYNVISESSEEPFTSNKIGLKQAGKFFILLENRYYNKYNYELTLNLENQAPFTVPGVTDCPTIQNPRFSSATGILDFPAIDVDNVFGGLTTYKGSLELVTSPSGDMTFKIKEVSPK